MHDAMPCAGNGRGAHATGHAERGDACEDGVDVEEQAVRAQGREAQGLEGDVVDSDALPETLDDRVRRFWKASEERYIRNWKAYARNSRAVNPES